jgi:hypothetical protein
VNETHNGELNRSKAPAPDKFEGTHGAKSNGETATLRTGSLPAASAVTCVDRDANKGAAVRAAHKQNVSLAPDGSDILNVIPNSGKAILTHPKGGE